MRTYVCTCKMCHKFRSYIIINFISSVPAYYDAGDVQSSLAKDLASLRTRLGNKAAINYHNAHDNNDADDDNELREEEVDVEQGSDEDVDDASES